jgi:hypothetical protein
MISHIGIRLTRQLTECELKDIVSEKAGVEIGNITRGEDTEKALAVAASKSNYERLRETVK